MLWSSIWSPTVWPWNSSRVTQEFRQEREGRAIAEKLTGPNHPENSNRVEAQDLQSILQQQKS